MLLDRTRVPFKLSVTDEVNDSTGQEETDPLGSTSGSQLNARGSTSHLTRVLLGKMTSTSLLVLDHNTFSRDRLTDKGWLLKVTKS